jgi:hypothetical protein
MTDTFLLSAAIITGVMGLAGWFLREKTKLPDTLATDVICVITAGAAYVLPEISVHYALGLVGGGVVLRRIAKGKAQTKG